MEKVFEQVMTEGSQYRLGMELYAENGIILMSDAHDLVDNSACRSGPGGYFQTVRQRFLLYHQGMVTGGDKQAFKTGEDV